MCCGQTARPVTPSLLAAAVPAGQVGQWEITFPSGNARKFPTEWQAEASRAVGGGTIKFIPANAPEVEEPEVEDAAPTGDVVAAATTSSTSTTEDTPTTEPAAAPPAPKPTAPPSKPAAAKPVTRTKKQAATPRKAPAKPSGD